MIQRPFLLLACLLATTWFVIAAERMLRPVGEPTGGQVLGAMRAAFPAAPAAWRKRLDQDATQAACTVYRNEPPAALAAEITSREAATIRYPSDGHFLGDWRRGEAIAQSGYGLRFTDTASAAATGGNCYACHRVTDAEVSFGTIGVSLKGYGRTRRYEDRAAKAAYEKIYNSHAAFPCSLMPRFGANGVLSIAQIKDLVALLMHPESPVNQ